MASIGSWFVTVGTTSFDELIQVVDSTEFLALAKKCGCTRLAVQYGRGAVEPCSFLSEQECGKVGISFESFRFKPSLEADMEAADLIISHGGAGSVLEAVTLQKLLIIVVNDSLQENHQTELADAMTTREYCFQTLPAGILGVLSDMAGRLEKAAFRRKPNREGPVPTATGSGTSSNSALLAALELQPYPDANLNAFPGAVDAIFNWD